VKDPRLGYNNPLWSLLSIGCNVDFLDKRIPGNWISVLWHLRMSLKRSVHGSNNSRDTLAACVVCFVDWYLEHAILITEIEQKLSQFDIAYLLCDAIVISEIQQI
jgi:hypothetical protein